MLRAAPPGHPLQKPTVVQWDIGAMLSADGAADESVSPQSGIRFKPIESGSRRGAAGSVWKVAIVATGRTMAFRAATLFQPRVGTGPDLSEQTHHSHRRQRGRRIGRFC